MTGEAIPGEAIPSGDANLYRYVGNAPTNATDPSGLAPVVEEGVFLKEDLKTAPAKIFVACMASEVFFTVAFAAAGIPPNLLDIGGSVLSCTVIPGAGGISKVDDLLDGATLIGKGKSNRFSKPGGFPRATKEFDELAANTGSKIKPQGKGVRSTKLPDGTNVSVRPMSSKNGPPTIQIDPPIGKTTKIRFL